MDIFPTLCAPAGVALPSGIDLDGEDLSDALLGKPIRRRGEVIWEYRRDASFLKPGDPEFVSPNLAIRDGPRKLLINADGTGTELYDIPKDPGETSDVAGENPQVATRLAGKVLGSRHSLPEF